MERSFWGVPWRWSPKGFHRSGSTRDFPVWSPGSDPRMEWPGGDPRGGPLEFWSGSLLGVPGDSPLVGPPREGPLDRVPWIWSRGAVPLYGLLGGVPWRRHARVPLGVP
jgi:hypothetical protein